MKRLIALLHPRKVLWITVAVVVLGPLVLLGGFLLIALAFQAEVEVNLAKALVAAAICILAATCYHVVRHLQRPKQTVTVRHDVQLIESALPLGRTTFKMEVYYEIEERGESQTVRQGTVELKFHKRDHPDLLAWCRQRVTRELERQRKVAEERYPDARILEGGGPSLAELTAGS